MRQQDIVHIIKHIKLGSEKAVSELIQHTIGLAMTIAKNILYNSEDIDDAVQESFIKTWKNIESYDAQKGLFSTWFFRIVQNECIDRNRKGKLLNHSQLTEDLIDPKQTVDEHFDYKQLRIDVLTIAQSLPIKQKEIFFLRDIQNLTIEEVQKHTGMTNGSIKTNLYLARKKIREVLKSREDQNG